LASVFNVESGEGRLVSLLKEPFYELMEDRIEIARGIIKVLSRRLRERVKDVTELRSRLDHQGALSGLNG
jgi:CRP-like cAMP-binding protein